MENRGRGAQGALLHSLSIVLVALGKTPLLKTLLAEIGERKSRDDRAASSHSAYKQPLYVSLNIVFRLRNLR